MSNPAVVKLDRDYVNKSMVWLDDNFGESIHIHIDDIRVDLTVEEFRILNEDLGYILNDLIQIDNFDITKIDPVYLSLWLWPKLSKISKVCIDNVNLDNVLVRSMDGRRIEELKNSVEVKALRKTSNENDSFDRKSNHVGQTDTQRLQGILDSIKKNGYPYNDNYIIMFGDDNLIRDGQHRASCLYYLFGAIDIPVMRIFFKDMKTPKKSTFYRSRSFYNSKIGYWSRMAKSNVISFSTKSLSFFKTSAISLLRSLGVNRRMVERNITKLENNIEAFNAR